MLCRDCPVHKGFKLSSMVHTVVLVIAVDGGMSLASKRDAVVDRQAKRDVVNEEKSRNRVRRKVIDDIGARGALFRKVYQPAGNQIDTCYD